MSFPANWNSPVWVALRLTRKMSGLGGLAGALATPTPVTGPALGHGTENVVMSGGFHLEAQARFVAALSRRRPWPSGGINCRGDIPS
jgi:hypothetical protein